MNCKNDPFRKQLQKEHLFDSEIYVILVSVENRKELIPWQY